MLPRKSKAEKYYLSIVAIITIVFLIVVFAFETNKKTGIANSYKLESLPNWEFEGEAIEFPFSFDAVTGREVSMSTRLPAYIPDDYVISFRTLYSKCSVYANEELIGEYAADPGMIFSKLTGNVRYIVPIPAKYAGKTIRISLVPYISQNADLAGFEFGTAGDAKLSIIYYNLLRLFTTTIMLTIAVVTLAFVIYSYYEKSYLNVNLVGNFTLFTFVVATWIICSSDIPQMLINRNGAVSVLSFLSLSLMPACFSGFCQYLLPKGEKIFNKIRLITSFLPAFNIFGMVTGLYDPPAVLIITHLSILVGAFFAVYYAAKGYKESLANKLLLAAIIELLAVAGAGFACFFIAPSRGFDGMIFGVGMLIFIVMLFMLIFVRQIKSIQEYRYVEVYKELAFTDILTGLNNRAAFEREFSRISEKGDIGTKISLFMFDLNFLKEVNDQYGHQAGDQLIVGLAECIEKAFDRFGTCYRLGGDEFAAVCINYPVNGKLLLEDFDRILEEHNNISEKKISVARGVSELPYNGESNFMSVLFKFADREMYIDKQIKHNQRA